MNFENIVAPMTVRICTWAPRAVAICVALFLALFAMDTLNGESAPGERLLHLAGHLIPTALCLFAVVLAWNRPLAGAVIFGGFAAFYAWYAWDHIDWVLLIAGPLVLVSVLYVVSAFQTRHQPN